MRVEDPFYYLIKIKMITNKEYEKFKPVELFQKSAFANIKLAQRLCKEMNYIKKCITTRYL
jgi:hypothetical protein